MAGRKRKCLQHFVFVYEIDLPSYHAVEPSHAVFHALSPSWSVSESFPSVSPTLHVCSARAVDLSVLFVQQP